MNRIRDARKAKGLTMKVLGQRIGVAESTVSMYENGKREPDHATLIKIANTLEVSVDYLLCQTEEPQEKKEVQQSEIPGLPDDDLIEIIANLTQHDVQRVRDFVEGLKAAREAQPSQNQ